MLELKPEVLSLYFWSNGKSKPPGLKQQGNFFARVTGYFRGSSRPMFDLISWLNNTDKNTDSFHFSVLAPQYHLQAGYEVAVKNFHAMCSLWERTTLPNAEKNIFGFYLDWTIPGHVFIVYVSYCHEMLCHNHTVLVPFNNECYSRGWQSSERRSANVIWAHSCVCRLVGVCWCRLGWPDGSPLSQEGSAPPPSLS